MARKWSASSTARKVLLASPPRTMNLGVDLFSGAVLRSGGTMLGTVNKGNPFDYPIPGGGTRDRSAEVVKAIHDLKIDGADRNRR